LTKFPIVGIGASAGGVEALEHLFGPMPTDLGAAFVVNTHLAPGKASLLPEIIGRFTAMPVVSADDGAVLEPDHVYVCPPGMVLSLKDGCVVATPASSPSNRRSIDVFLSSLAEEARESAIGILLSGTGVDGTLGLKAIKECGGFTLVQGADGGSPGFTGMPESAIAAGVVDFVIPADSMPVKLASLIRGLVEPGKTAIPDDESEAAQKIRSDICALLLRQVGHDFTGYKNNTFMRRVHRRMQVQEVDRLIDYVTRLHEDAEEVAALFRDLLIGVTNFFRDTEAFATLAEMVVPKLFDGKGANETIRIWVPGCSTGEEAYSIAILVRERLDAMRSPVKVQIFATDIDEPALAIARAGRYPVNLLRGVSAERLARFFSGDELTKTIAGNIRQMCMFSAHNLLRDPPFSRIDLVSCRNLLIYFGIDFQARAFPIFHFALKPGGHLFLGTSENVGQHPELFAPIDRKSRVFQRRDHVATRLQFASAMGGARRASSSSTFRTQPDTMAEVRGLVDARMLDRHTPAHVVVNREGDVLHYSAGVGRFLEPAVGQPTRQLVAMARRGLHLDLRSALREATESGKPVERNHIVLETPERRHVVDLLVEPIGQGANDPLFLVVFRDVPERLSLEGGVSSPGQTGEVSIVEELERELRDTREQLQGTIEEYETAVEELKSSNEELQSINEELQSANEEMETSKEELQSVNEELQTVNSELTGKIDKLDRANSDLRNVFDSTQLATVFLDSKLRVRSFTPAATALFNLIPSDRGRPLTDIVNNLRETVPLRVDIESVFASGRSIERRVHHAERNIHYLMRILPYSGETGTINGALVTFIDVTDIVEGEQRQRTLMEELNHRVRNMLTVIGAIAQRTLRQTESPAQFVDAFEGRIQSMGRSYTLVSREGWGHVRLEDILKGEFEIDGIVGQGRIGYRGPDIWLAPSGALALGMALHELTTNATRYGALSVESGRLEVAWVVAGETLSLTWTERGGPPAVSLGKGFGKKLVTGQVEGPLHGSVLFDFTDQGLVVSLSLPIDGATVSTVRPLEGDA
jgi:two-component system CheB/CheR fusion protein